MELLFKGNTCSYKNRGHSTVNIFRCALPWEEVPVISLLKVMISLLYPTQLFQTLSVCFYLVSVNQTPLNILKPVSRFMSRYLVGSVAGCCDGLWAWSWMLPKDKVRRVSTSMSMCWHKGQCTGTFPWNGSPTMNLSDVASVINWNENILWLRLSYNTPRSTIIFWHTKNGSWFYFEVSCRSISSLLSPVKPQWSGVPVKKRYLNRD